MKIKNEIQVFGDTTIVYLSSGNIMLIDTEDIKYIVGSKVYEQNGYAVRRLKWNESSVSIHKLILGKKEGYEIDHINQNRLDNRKENLRFVTSKQNKMNRYSSKGVCYRKNSKRKKRWYSYIMLDGKQISLGYYETEKEAIEARIKGEKKYFGEYAPVREVMSNV